MPGAPLAVNRNCPPGIVRCPLGVGAGPSVTHRMQTWGPCWGKLELDSRTLSRVCIPQRGPRPEADTPHGPRALLMNTRAGPYLRSHLTPQMHALNQQQRAPHGPATWFPMETSPQVSPGRGIRPRDTGATSKIRGTWRTGALTPGAARAVT